MIGGQQSGKNQLVYFNPLLFCKCPIFTCPSNSSLASFLISWLDTNFATYFCGLLIS